MRLFIALRFDERALKQLTAVQGKLCRSAARCSPVQRDSLHMTLAFLGEVENARTAALKHILDSLDPAPRSLRFDTVGSFANGIWWCGPGRSPPLTRLHSQLRRALREQGFAVEDRPFVPHVTLARRVVPNAPGALPQLQHPFAAQVRSVSLMRSQLGKGAPAYTELYAVPPGRHSAGPMQHQ